MKTYEVVDGKLVITTEIPTPDPEKQTYSLEELYRRKSNVEGNMASLAISYSENKARYQAELDEIDACISEAIKLGLTEIV